MHFFTIRSCCLASSGPPALPPLHGNAGPLHRGQWGYSYRGVSGTGIGKALLQAPTARRSLVQPSRGVTRKFFWKGFVTDASEGFLKVQKFFGRWDQNLEHLILKCIFQFLLQYCSVIYTSICSSLNIFIFCSLIIFPSPETVGRGGPAGTPPGGSGGRYGHGLP